MKLILTSFEINKTVDHWRTLSAIPLIHLMPSSKEFDEKWLTTFTSHGNNRKTTLFELLDFSMMPPINMRRWIKNSRKSNKTDTSFELDFAALLLCDQIIMDEASYEKLRERNDIYKSVKETVELLLEHNFVKLENFTTILERSSSLFDRMVEHDLSILPRWYTPLTKSIGLWEKFQQTNKNVAPQSHLKYWDTGDKSFSAFIQTTIKDIQKKQEVGYNIAILRYILSTYLSYINSNIIISNELNAGFYDWADFLPFYKTKFLFVGKEDIATQKQINASRKLFEVAFPEFSIKDPKTFIKIMTDKRVLELRQLVDDAVNGKVVFDNKFAKSVYREVFNIEQRITKYRNVTSYLTLPIDFIPLLGNIGQKVVEELAGKAIEKKLKQPYQWFYMLDKHV